MTENIKVNDLIKKKEDLLISLSDYKNKIFNIENEIIEIEREINSFTDDTIINTLELSEQQKLIINAKEDNILVVACPGSGKTHTLISRYINIILNPEFNIKEDEVLLITFTKKAGLEMLHRVSKYVPNKLPYYIGSIHGLGFKVLQEYNNDFNYTILDEKDTKDYINYIIDSNIIDNNEIIKSKINIIIDQISITYPLDILPVIKKHNMDKYSEQIIKIYNLYQEKKKKENILDFNDLMILFCQFLDSTSKKSMHFRNKIKYVFFDEYQDSNPIQNYILSRLAKKSKIMLVGDDAQSIYSFRGSSVKYILNFNNVDTNKKSKKMYLLEENYRSTSSIVNFCQNIIDHNYNKFEKNVISKQNNIGLKPSILEFTNDKSQYEWIANDIIKNISNGYKLSDMVILARKNSSLSKIELYLSAKKIEYVKHIGSSLLEKSHIKDFLAYITVLVNPKSSIHWKRIIGLQYGMKKANEIVSSNDNIINTLINHNCKELYDFFNILKHVKKDNDKIKIISTYLEKLWSNKKDYNINAKIIDINKILNFVKGSSLEDFINDLYLNQEIETNLENILYLTTVHSAKGLEWKHVYIIDMDCNNFPMTTKNKYYVDELMNMEEERRLFYVAASRAKNYLAITYCTSFNSQMSPFIREMNPELYNGCGINIIKPNLTLYLTKDVQNYIKYNGYYNITEQLLKLTDNITDINKFTINNNEELDYNIINTFFDYLIIKMIQINFPTKIKKFSLQNLMSKENNFPQKIYSEYIDSNTDWRNILEYILYIAMFNKNQNDIYSKILINNDSIDYYIYIEKQIIKIIETINPKSINTHHVISHGSVSSSIKILCDNTIIDINTFASTIDLSVLLLNAYLLKKNDHDINNIILLNLFEGEIHDININKINLIKFKKTIYYIT